METEVKPQFKALPVDSNLAIGSLSSHFAGIVCGHDKQDVAALLVAPKGYGKSYSALDLAVKTAKSIAYRIGGTWTDYFPYDKENNWLPNCATIVTQDIIQMIGQTKPHNVYILDDIGVGWNARKFRDKANILMNDIFELIRIDNTVIIMTVMDQSFIDKVPRSIVPFFMEISQKYHEVGYNEVKVFTHQKLFRDGKSIHSYLTHGREKYVRFYSEMPPDFICQAYDHMRSIKTAEDRKKKLEAFMSQKDENKAGKRAEHWKQMDELYGDKIVESYHRGKPTVGRIAKEVGVAKSVVPVILRERGLSLVQ